MEKIVHKDKSTVDEKRRRECLWELLVESDIEKMCQQLMPSCKSSEHVKNFFENLKYFRGSHSMQIYNGYETYKSCKRYFLGYTMIHLYQKNNTDIGTISRVVLSYLEHFHPHALSSLRHQEREAHYTEWNDMVFKIMIANAVDDAHYGFVNFFVKYGKCSFTAPYDELDELLYYFMKAMLPGQGASQIRNLAKNVDMSYSRLVLTMFVIEMVLRCKMARTLDDVEKCIRTARCIDLLARTTAEPLIAFIDVYEVARYCAHSRTRLPSQDESTYRLSSSQFRPSLEEVRPQLLKLFRDMSDWRQARSLCDLGRKKIRESLGSDRVLTHQVASLPLPNRLKNFILFHESDLAQFMWDDVTDKFS